MVFKPFPALVTLVIDDNHFASLATFPVLKRLETFSANKNNFGDLTIFIEEGFDRFGNLKNLSLLKNPLNPFFEGEQKYNIYRNAVLRRFRDLKTLDGCAVTVIQREMVEQRKEEAEKYEKVEGVAVYDQKYTVDQVKSVKGRSEGNRFLKNDQL